jgi:hypothetical protein
MGARAPRTARRLLLTAIAVSITATALLAIGILLFGSFGETEGRILGSTMILAGYALLALPAGFLLDQSRHLPLAAAVVGLAAAGLVLSLVNVWTGGGSSDVGKAVLTATVFAGAAAQTAALAARRAAGDPILVRALFPVSCALALVLATMASVAAWAEFENAVYFRILGSLAVLDLLTVALQPVLALARSPREVHHLHLVVDQGEAVETDVEAVDFATAASRAIRDTERSGRRVLRLERSAARRDGYE